MGLRSCPSANLGGLIWTNDKNTAEHSKGPGPLGQIDLLDNSKWAGTITKIYHGYMQQSDDKMIIERSKLLYVIIVYQE